MTHESGPAQPPLPIDLAGARFSATPRLREGSPPRLPPGEPAGEGLRRRFQKALALLRRRPAGVAEDAGLGNLLERAPAMEGLTQGLARPLERRPDCLGK